MSTASLTTLTTVGPFLYDQPDSECPLSKCEARPASQMDVGTYLGQIDRDFRLRDGRGAFISEDGSMY